MFADADLIPLSALQHLLFCQRQCALIHLEQLWAENSLTLQGQHMHKKAHEAHTEQRGQGDVRISRGISLCSYRHGLIGKADVVEFHKLADGDDSRHQTGAQLTDKPGRWRPLPIEYKRGKPKRDDSDRVQLCAQALCLEEMLDVDVPVGAIFYGKTRRRLDVPFDEQMRSITLTTIDRLHQLFASGRTPVAKREPKCDRCSLLALCMPDAAGRVRSVKAYVERNITAAALASPAVD